MLSQRTRRDERRKWRPFLTSLPSAEYLLWAHGSGFPSPLACPPLPSPQDNTGSGQGGVLVCGPRSRGLRRLCAWCDASLRAFGPSMVFTQGPVLSCPGPPDAVATLRLVRRHSSGWFPFPLCQPRGPAHCPSSTAARKCLPSHDSRRQAKSPLGPKRRRSSPLSTGQPVVA